MTYSPILMNNTLHGEWRALAAEIGDDPIFSARVSLLEERVLGVSAGTEFYPSVRNELFLLRSEFLNRLLAGGVGHAAA